MTAEELATRLDAKRNGKGWVAHCPAHDDHTPSLGIDEGTEGRVLLNCRAGCTFNAIVSAMGLKPADLFPLKPERQKCERGRIVATYDYTDAAGKLLFQVCRFDPKDFKQRRPDPDHPGRWLWNMNGQTRVLYRLPDVLKTKTEGRAVFCIEGEKDADALAALGLCATCNPGGAGKWAPAYTETLTKAKVIVLPDRDTPGRRHAALVLRELTGKAESVRVVELPDRDGRKVKDAADWIGAGGTVEELRKIVRTAPAWEPPPDEPEEQTAAPSVTAETNGKPAVLLPHGAQSISDAGRALGVLLAKTERFFIRGGAVVKLAQDPDGLPHLEDVKPAALASDFEAVSVLCKPDGLGNVAAATCPKQTAELIAASAAFRDALPPIHVLTRCPVLIERGRELIQVSGYDRESGIFAAGMPAELMDVAEARRLLSDILAGFRFATPADRARALAAMVTPALVFGGLVKSLRPPVDLGEADQKQTGKGYRDKLTGAVYAQSVTSITQRKQGVGGIEESFDMALIRGANFIELDNVRGKLDSQALESFVTQDRYTARAPYRQPVEIDPRRVCIMLTSNKADGTPDLAARCSCVRLLKQPEGHAFTPYPEGDILEHVRARQPRYLGAVFAIVRAWYDAGKPRTTETRHDFRPWAQTLDWIVRNLLDAGPLLDGHRETQARMTNPVLNWLRDVALEVIHAQRAGVWLRASDLLELIAESGTETPGLPEHGDLTDPETRTNALQATGRRLGLCFRAGGVLSLDSMAIERREGYDAGRFKTLREYRFAAPPMDGQTIGGTPKQTPDAAQVGLPETPAEDVSAYAPPMRPPMKPPMKPLIPPMPPMTPLQCEHSGTATNEEGSDIDSKGTYRRIGGTPEPVDPEEVNAALALSAAEDAGEYEEGEL